MTQVGEQAAGLTILIVEDDEDTLVFLKLALTSETPYGVLLMKSGIETLQRLNEVEAVQPALLLLDYHLPKMTALDLYDRLHAQAKLAQVPALMITADPLCGEIRRALAERNIALLEKPFGLDELFQRIEQTMKPPAQGFNGGFNRDEGNGPSLANISSYIAKVRM